MILVFGTICLDRVRRIPHFPKPGGYVEQMDDRILLGGEAANTANALKTWGADVHLAGNWLGKGDDGQLLRRLLNEQGLNVLIEDSGEAEAPICDIFLTPDGQRTMVGRGFSTMDGQVDLAKLPFQSGCWFTAEPNMSETSRKAVQMAAQAGMHIYLMDFFGEDEKIPEGAICQYSTDWVGVPDDLDTNEEWTRQWSMRHGCTTILTDAANGFFVSLPDGIAWHQASAPTPGPVIDSTGAGDIFRAGMLYGLAQAWPLARCLPFASAAGAISTQSLGATTKVPSPEEILNWER